MADPKEVETRNTLFQVESVEFTEKFRDSSYALHVESPATMTCSGHLKLFDLVTKEADLPTFLGRWDERSQTVDIDALDRDGNRLKDWKNKKLAKKMGHHGHHTDTRPDYESLAYECRLIWKGRLIFHAVIELVGRHIRRHLSTTVTSTAQISLKVIRALPEG